MILRTGFVSNSSSSSFILIGISVNFDILSDNDKLEIAKIFTNKQDCTIEDFDNYIISPNDIGTYIGIMQTSYGDIGYANPDVVVDTIIKLNSIKQRFNLKEKIEVLYGEHYD